MATVSHWTWIVRCTTAVVAGAASGAASPHPFLVLTLLVAADWLPAQEPAVDSPPTTRYSVSLFGIQHVRLPLARVTSSTMPLGYTLTWRSVTLNCDTFCVRKPGLASFWPCPVPMPLVFATRAAALLGMLHLQPTRPRHNAPS